MSAPEALVARAVAALIDGNSSEARASLLAIDFEALGRSRRAARDVVWGPNGAGTRYRGPRPRKPRESVPKVTVDAVFERDRYTCRYAHCRRRTISLQVLKLLSTAFPEILPYRPNWKPVEHHLLYWTCSTSLEHGVAFPSGGSSELENLLTACYQCNDTKNHLPLELLGWTVSSQVESEWDGLVGAIPDLKLAVKGRPHTRG